MGTTEDRLRQRIEALKEENVNTENNIAENNAKLPEKEYLLR